MTFTQKIKTYLEELNLIIKLSMLVIVAICFFILFPFLLNYGKIVYIILFSLFSISLSLLRIISGKKIFRITIWLWASGSIIYLIIAGFMIYKRIQPLPYIYFQGWKLLLYYLSYPLRLLGIFATGIIFVTITSPIEFLKWGNSGLKIALAYRAFEYSINAIEENRISLIIQGEWPDFSEGRRGLKRVYRVIKYAPKLVATTLRNIILWVPWAWICYNTLKKEIFEEGKK